MVASTVATEVCMGTGEWIALGALFISCIAVLYGIFRNGKSDAGVLPELKGELRNIGGQLTTHMQYITKDLTDIRDAQKSYEQEQKKQGKDISEIGEIARTAHSIACEAKTTIIEHIKEDVHG